MTVLIINADDFGYSRAINFGIIDSYKNGILTSTTIMPNMPGFEHATELAKENPGLGIGVHLTLTCGSPLSPSVPSLTEDGEFRNLSFYERPFSIDEDELYEEWDLQIKRVLDAGINPSHLDTHHHVNMFDPLQEVFVKLARKYRLPVRNNFNVPDDISTVNRFFIDLDNLGATKDVWKPLIVNSLIQDYHKYGTVEAMCHPGYLDDTVFENSALLKNRVSMARELMDDSYKELLENHNIKLGTFRNI
ncbi:carbohydrate deacetylase [Alkalibacterium psychrotolerans]